MASGEVFGTVELKASALPTPISPGVRTTEFWLSLLSTIFFACVSVGVFPDTPSWAKAVAVASAALTTLGYGGTRALIKSAAMPILLVGLLLVGGCANPGAQAAPPDLGAVTVAQLLLLGYETRTESRYEAGKMSFAEYTKTRALEKAAATALETAATAAENNQALTRDQQLEIARGILKGINTALLDVPATQPAQ